MESVRLLEYIIPVAKTVMTKVLTEQCCAHLKLITDIPRLYRKTNREVRYYVINLLFSIVFSISFLVLSKLLLFLVYMQTV